MTTGEFLAKLSHVKKAGPDQWKAQCPSHEDTSRDSLSIRAVRDQTLLHCFGGGGRCTAESITAAVGCTVADLFVGDKGPQNRRIVKTYDYVSHEGVLLFQVVRYEPKDFRQRRPDGSGGWIWNLDGVSRVLYRCPDLVEAERVYWPEGEKDADRLVALGLTATTTPGGAAAFGKADYAAQLGRLLVGRREVLVLRDEDAAGARYAEVRLPACHAVDLTVKDLRLPGLPPKGDVSDWLALGHTREELEALADAAPAWTPSQALPSMMPRASHPSVSGAQVTEPWPTPEPVRTALAPVPAFDVESLLPVGFASWVADIAERAQCPIDFVAVGAIVALAGVVGRSVTIRPKQQDSWIVVPNLWGLAIGRPGIMKSPALSEALKPLHRLVAEAREAYLEKLKAYEFDQVAVKTQKALLQDKLKKALRDGADVEALRAEFDALETPEPTERRYLVNDSTVEKLGELLNENPNGLLLFRDELSGFLSTMDREGHENDRAFFAESWNGTGSYTYDRIGRGTVRIAAACTSILGAMQPGPVHVYLREVFGAGRTDDGLIQRFQVMVYPDVSPAWRNVDRWPDTEAKTRAFAIFQQLAQFDARELGAHWDQEEGPPYFRFTPEAQAQFDAWRAQLEHALRDPGEHPVVVSHLAKYRSLMPALALLFHLVDCVARGTGGPVSELATTRAIAWCTYLEAHARRVYQSLTEGPYVAAGQLAAKITQGVVPTPFTAYWIRRHGWTGLTMPEEVSAAVDLLEELGWVRCVARRSTVRGGRSTAEYHINPVVTGGTR